MFLFFFVFVFFFLLELSLLGSLFRLFSPPFYLLVYFILFWLFFVLSFCFVLFLVLFPVFFSFALVHLVTSFCFLCVFTFFFLYLYTHFFFSVLALFLNVYFQLVVLLFFFFILSWETKNWCVYHSTHENSSIRVFYSFNLISFRSSTWIVDGCHGTCTDIEEINQTPYTPVSSQLYTTFVNSNYSWHNISTFLSPTVYHSAGNISFKSFNQTTFSRHARNPVIDVGFDKKFTSQ